jgi:hypothetical protein
MFDGGWVCWWEVEVGGLAVGKEGVGLGIRRNVEAGATRGLRFGVVVDNDLGRGA